MMMMMTSAARDAHLSADDPIVAADNIAGRKRPVDGATDNAPPPRIKRKPTQRTSDVPWNQGDARAVINFLQGLRREPNRDPSWSDSNVLKLHSDLGQPPLDPKSPSFIRRIEDDPISKAAIEAAYQGVDLEKPTLETKLMLRKLYVDHSMRPELINDLWTFPCLQRSASFKDGFVAEHVSNRYEHSIWQQQQN